MQHQNQKIKTYQENYIKYMVFDYGLIVSNTDEFSHTLLSIKPEMRKGVMLKDKELHYCLSNLSDYPGNEKSVFVHGMSSRNNTSPYREKIGDWQYELRDLHIGGKAEVFYSGEGIIVEVGDSEFDFEIRSKNTNRIIKKLFK